MRMIGLVLFMSCLAAHAEGLLLQPGDTFVYTFDSLPFVRTTNTPPYSRCALVFPFPDGLAPGESFRLELFEDNVVGAPFLSYVFTNAGTVGEITGGALETHPIAHWLDLQGSIRVSMLTGAMHLSEATFAT